MHELEPRVLAQLAVEGGEGLVEQQHLRPFHQRARERNALALAAGQLVRLALGEALQPDQGEHLLDAGLDRVARQAVLTEAECDVALDREVGKQRIGLEHHVHRPPVRRHGTKVLVGEEDATFVRGLETCEQA